MSCSVFASHPIFFSSLVLNELEKQFLSLVGAKLFECPVFLRETNQVCPSLSLLLAGEQVQHDLCRLPTQLTM